MRDMDVKLVNAVAGIITPPENRMLVTESKNDSEIEEVTETKTVTRRTRK